MEAKRYSVEKGYLVRETIRVGTGTLKKEASKTVTRAGLKIKKAAFRQSDSPKEKSKNEIPSDAKNYDWPPAYVFNSLKAEKANRFCFDC